MEGWFTFQWGGGCFSDGGGASFLSGRLPHGGIGFDGGGGVLSKKIFGWGRALPYAPHYGKPCHIMKIKEFSDMLANYDTHLLGF